MLFAAWSGTAFEALDAPDIAFAAAFATELVPVAGREETDASGVVVLEAAALASGLEDAAPDEAEVAVVSGAYQSTEPAALAAIDDDAAAADAT